MNAAVLTADGSLQVTTVPDPCAHPGEAPARRLGASVVVDPGVEDPPARAQSVGGRIPDGIFECVGAIAAGRFDVGPLITDVVALDELGFAFAALGAPTAQGEVLVEL